ncbi:MAG: TIGR02281 family clan AA aspartic protease, partial [Pirellulaceae bacterium]|nr:TIGR02281 family clan AA aspartic protease [Pirellulaceae bacterium]
MNRGWVAFAALLAFVVVGLIVLHRLNPGVLESESGLMRVIYASLLLLIIGPAVFAGRLRGNLRNLMVWAGLLVVVALAYTAWQQGNLAPQTIRAELDPHRSVVHGDGEARITADAGGDFVVEALVDGVPVVFLVDTGASDVVLSRADAGRVGLDPDSLAYTRAYATANGTAFGAPVRLASVAVGSVALDDVRASVSQSGLNTSL